MGENIPSWMWALSLFPPYRFCFAHIDGGADGHWVVLSSPVHFFHHAVHVASRKAMEKHRSRGGEDIITVLFGSAGQDVHQRRRNAVQNSRFFRFFLSRSFKWEIQFREEYEGKVGHVFSALRLICQWKPSSDFLQLSLLIRLYSKISAPVPVATV